MSGIIRSGKNGLQDLVVQPRDAQNWKGPYIKDATGLPLDPWGHPYVYEFPGRHTRQLLRPHVDGAGRAPGN